MPAKPARPDGDAGAADQPRTDCHLPAIGRTGTNGGLRAVVRTRAPVTGRARLAMALVLVGAGVAASTLVIQRRGAAAVDGALVYARRCAFCHDVEGAVGGEITASTLASRGDEDALYRYLRLAMPYEAPGSMTDAEYRATARHLLESRGLAGGSGGGSATASDAGDAISHDSQGGGGR